MAFADSPGLRSASTPSTLVETVTLAAACHVGDLLAYSSGWVLATLLLDSAGLVALQAGASGDNVLAGPVAMVKGFTGGTPGDPVYVDGTTAGGYTTTAPTTPRFVGRMLTDHSAFIDLGRAARVSKL